MIIELTKAEACVIVNILQSTKVRAESIEEMQMIVHGYEKILESVQRGQDPEPEAAGTEEPAAETEPEVEAEPAAAAEKKTDKRTPRTIDHGKVKALRDAGWKIKAIAEEVGCHANSVRAILEKFREKEEQEALAKQLQELQK